MVTVRGRRPTEPKGRQLRCLCGVTPWEEFVEAGDFVIGDFAENPSQPTLRIDVVELGGFDEGEGKRHGFAAAF